MKLRRITALLLTILMAASTLVFTAGAEAADKVLDFTKMQRGVCDNKDTGTVETVKDSAKGNVVKFAINPAASSLDYITVDGYSAGEFEIDISAYKYMVLEMRFVSSTIESIKPSVRFLSIVDAGNVSGLPYLESVNDLPADGNWYDVVIDMETGLAGKFSGSPAIMNHLQYRIGGGAYKADKFGAGDEIYVGKVTLTNKAVATGSATATGTTVSGGSNAGASTGTGTGTASSSKVSFDAGDKVLEFAKVQAGICDNKDTGRVDKVEESGRQVVKFTITPDAALQDYITVDGYGAVPHGIDVSKYKYMVLEMRFDSEKVESIKPVVRFLSTTEGNIEGLPYLTSENALVSDGNWYYVLIDMEKGLAGKISGSPVIMNHLQYSIGGREKQAADFGDGDAIYVGKMILTNKKIETGASIGKGEATSAPTTDGRVFNAEDLVIDYTKMQRGICDHKDTGEVRNANDSEMGEIVQFVINPDAENQDYITIDGYGSESLGIDITKHKYMIIDMKFDSSTVDSIYPVMRFLSAVDVSIPGAPYLKSAEPLPADGQWHKVVINMYNGLKNVVDSASDAVVMKHLQFSCGGRDIKASGFGKGDIISIAKVTLTNENPNKDKDFTISFASGFNNAVGTAPASIVGKPGTKYTIPEVPFTAEGYETAGWMMGSDGKTSFAPGKEMVIGEESVEYTAIWKQKIEAKEYVSIDYAGYYNGICDHVDTATGEATSLGGKPVIKVVPNPATTSTKGEAINLDGWSYGGAKMNLALYKTILIEYLYLSDKPVEGNAKFNIMARNLSGQVQTVSNEPIVEGRWATFSFDMRPAEAKFIPTAEPNIMQAHIYPLGSNSVKNMSADDVIYIGKIIAIPEAGVTSAEHEKYINGYADGTFGINGNMTRAEACTIVARLAACGEANIPADLTTAFTDVAKDQWYHKYIAYVESLGFLKSYSGTFAPNQNITRAEFVELVYNMGLLTDAGKNGTFTDVPADHARASVISAAGKAGLVNGYANGDGTFSFKPDATITRAEVVKVINNAYGKKPSGDGIFESAKNKFSDVTPDHWAYADIIDAAVSHISIISEDGKETWKVVTDTEAASEDFNADFEAGAAKMAEVAALIDKRAEEIKNTPNMDLSGITGKKVYVSSSTGNDANDGLSADKPVKTIAKANAIGGAKGSVILLKRGDTWRERFTAVTGVTYTAYGEGAKPVINANVYGDAADESLWTLVEGTTNIWKYAKTIPDVGNIVVNGNKTIEKFTAGVRYANGQMLVGSTVIDPKTCLKEDNYFVSIYTAVNGETAAMDSSILYVRCDAGNPGKVYDSIELCYRGHGISGRSGMTLDNIALFYAGSHGVSMGTVDNVKFTNMEIGWIGGSAQNTSGGVMTRFGNGIEVYGGCNNYVIDNCYVYECYDAGITHQKQLGGGDSCTEQNVFFTNNVIDKCIYNIEYFMGIADTKGTTRFMKNINYKNNLLARSGYGWGASPSRSASIKGWDHHNNHAEDFTIEGNVFFMDRVNAVDLGVGNIAWLPVFKGNTYIQKYANTLTKLGANGATQYMMDSTSAYNLEKVIGEKGAQLFFVKADTVVE